MASADRLIEIFNAAKVRPAGPERDGFLAESCGADAELKEHVLSLLRAHENAGGFLQAGPALSPEIEAELARLKPEEVGERIGAYKLREQIGEGGFGVVWVAEQLEPVRRTVALKIIKLGMDTREVVARFEQERQALAMMDHPNIARVFDAGATEHGRPFFVMELVRGIKITEYCDQANLSTAERLQLFITVCQAVQHAHQKGIIHRDIKPSNILVTLHDGVPVPKVIDFGVAKATQGRLSDATVYTRFQQMIGTPVYMSPEQAEMSGLDVDTRTDIYALGVLLYELLTGRTPFDPEALMKAGLDEMRRVIREQEPQTPSMFLRTMAVATRTTVAQHRQADPAKLAKLVCGDLDWIVMKALEKDRIRRYETVNDLARDIQRHLKNEPVLASPPSRVYRLRRFLKRNKAGFAISATVAAALVLSALVIIWQRVWAYGVILPVALTYNELTELKEEAWTFARQAHALVVKGRFAEAIEKLDYAHRLRPDVCEFLVAKGDLLECQSRFAEAAMVYRAALRLSPGNDRARSNLVLCERFDAEQTAQSKLSTESLAELVATMVRERRSEAEMLPAVQSAQFGNGHGRLVRDYWLVRLQGFLPLGPGMSVGQRLTTTNSGLALDLSNAAIFDLSPLEGMPLTDLNLTNCLRISDLQAIGSMPLRDLCLVGTKVTDLSPLRGAPLVGLKLSNPINDPSQLLDLPKLEFLVVSRWGSPLEILRQHPTLKRIGYPDDALLPVADFWAAYDAQRAARPSDSRPR